MDKILNKSKSMLFGRKNGKKDDNLRDSESFYDMEENSWSPKMHAQTLGLKTKNTMSTEPSSYSHPHLGLGGYLNGTVSNVNYYASRRDTQSTTLPRHKSTALDRSLSTTGANPSTLSLNAHGGERYRLEMNSSRGRSQSTIPFQVSPRDIVETSDQTKNKTASARTDLGRTGTGDLKVASPSQLSDTSYRGCSISAPITSGLFALETKFDTSTNRTNVETLRSTSAGEGLGRHIPTSSNSCSMTSLNRMETSDKDNEQKHTPRSPGGPSPLRGRRSLNFFNTPAQTLISGTRSTGPLSSGTERYNVSGFPRSVKEREMSFKSGDNQLLPNLVRYGTENRVFNSLERKERESESIKSKTISAPILDNNNGGPRLFHSRAVSDNHISFNSVQPLSLRSHPKFQKKPNEHPEPFEEGSVKERGAIVSPNTHESSPSILQTSSSLPTPPTSSTTLSFIANELDMSKLDIDKELNGRLNFKVEANANVTSRPNQTPPTRSEELNVALKVQNKKLDELCERVSALNNLLHEEMTSKKLFVKRISHLENEVRGLRWILSERERTKRADWSSELMESDSRGSHSQVASTDSSNSRYDRSSVSHTTEKDKEGRITRRECKYSTDHTLAIKIPPPASKMDDNRRKRFGLALDPQS
ncbi:hypothetical protein Clacol_009021 [Clathrus columnatus]|uniref:Uncharacterized protein n=1 Tax=Clathrus columnatus TaxID=1419009 RepID=A0AAV5ANX1_9AGAM|nr:hypothetical protein Clacol_009021 [Clathrus columnatus]